MHDSQQALAHAHSDLNDTLNEWQIERPRLETSASSTHSQLIACCVVFRVAQARLGQFCVTGETLEGRQTYGVLMRMWRAFLVLCICGMIHLCSCCLVWDTRVVVAATMPEGVFEFVLKPPKQQLGSFHPLFRESEFLPAGRTPLKRDARGGALLSSGRRRCRLTRAVITVIRV